MKAQYQVLSDLKRVDDKVTRLQTEMDQIPEEARKLDQLLRTHREEYEKIKAQTELAEKELRSIEADLREREDKLNKAQSKMMEVKTNDEYQAALKENQAQKEVKLALEEKAILLLTQVEAQRARLKEAEASFKTQESSTKEAVQALEKEKARIAGLLEEHTQKRNQIATSLSSDVSSVYHRLVNRSRGGVIAMIESGMCLSCHMRVRPQLYNEILGYKAIHKCPSCGKILIHPQADEPAASH